MYAVLGVNLFAKVRPGKILSNHTNFHNFGAAMLLLIRACTGESWNDIMHDCSVRTNCDPAADCAMGTCCGSAGAPLYFGSFFVLAAYITLNLLVAVIVDNFGGSKVSSNRTVTEEDIQRFRDAWQARNHPYTTHLTHVPPHVLTHLTLPFPPALPLPQRFDPDAAMFIHIDHFMPLLYTCPPPLGLEARSW